MLTMAPNGHTSGIIAHTAEEAKQEHNDRNKQQHNKQSPSPVLMPTDEEQHNGAKPSGVQCGVLPPQSLHQKKGS